MDEAIIQPSRNYREVAAWVVYMSVVVGGACYAWLKVPFSGENYTILALFSVGLVATPIVMRTRGQLSPNGMPFLAGAVVALVSIAWFASTTWTFLKTTTNFTDGQLIGLAVVVLIGIVASAKLLKLARRYAIFSWSALFVLAVGFATNWTFALVAAAAAGLFYQYYKHRSPSERPHSSKSPSDDS